MNETLQLAIVGIVVVACLWRAVKRYAPKTAWQWQAKLSYQLEQGRRPGWLRTLGQWLRPTVGLAGNDCNAGCASCRGCSTAIPAADPLRIQLRS